jgi:hypothetical protein
MMFFLIFIYDQKIFVNIKHPSITFDLFGSQHSLSAKRDKLDIEILSVPLVWCISEI